MDIIEVKPSNTTCLNYLADITQIQYYNEGSMVQARGPKVESRNQLSETAYKMPDTLAFWIRKFRIQAREAFWIGKSRIDGKIIIKLRNQLYKIRMDKNGVPELEYIPDMEGAFNIQTGTPDAITKGGEMIDYKSTLTVSLSKSRNNADNKILLLC
jgi:hypothetical protein